MFRVYAVGCLGPIGLASGSAGFGVVMGGTSLGFRGLRFMDS